MNIVRNNEVSVKRGSTVPAFPAATLKSDTPTRVIVGAMVSGPMKRRRKPTRPVKPMTIWNNDETIMAPWIFNIHVR